MSVAVAQMTLNGGGGGCGDLGMVQTISLDYLEVLSFWVIFAAAAKKSWKSHLDQISGLPLAKVLNSRNLEDHWI